MEFIAPLWYSMSSPRNSCSGSTLIGQRCDSTIASELQRAPRRSRRDRDLPHYLCNVWSTGGRLGDIYAQRMCSGRRARLHVSPVVGLANPAPIDRSQAGARFDRGADGAAGARHPSLLFADGRGGRAFGIYGIVLACGGAGFLLGGVLVTLDLRG